MIDQNRSSRVDFRINTLPGPYGEDVVLRVLDVGMGLLPIDQLGMTVEMGRDFQQLLENPEGAVLVTGPTGSGKNHDPLQLFGYSERRHAENHDR